MHAWINLSNCCTCSSKYRSTTLTKKVQALVSFWILLFAYPLLIFIFIFYLDVVEDATNAPSISEVALNSNVLNIYNEEKEQKEENKYD